jgi:hypothetical protein
VKVVEQSDSCLILDTAPTFSRGAEKNREKLHSREKLSGLKPSPSKYEARDLTTGSVTSFVTRSVTECL